MNTPLHIRNLRLFRLAIPLRLRFEHAGAARDTADPIIVELTGGAPHAHLVGYGETLARPYVTGETPESVFEDITNLFAPLLAEFRCTSFVEALEFIEALPMQLAGRVVTAARRAVSTAMAGWTAMISRRWLRSSSETARPTATRTM